MEKTDKKKEQEIIDLYKSGLSMAKVGEFRHISPTTVMRILDRNNIQKEQKAEFMSYQNKKL